MNSEHIRLRFGSYGVDILGQSEDRRLANLYSESAGERICRTLALTHFLLPTKPALEAPDALIRGGASIGATLYDAGFCMVKSDRIFSRASSGAFFEALSSGGIGKGTPLATQVYTLNAERDGHQYPYAIIAEAYHPDHVAPRATDMPIERLLSGLNGVQRTTLEELNWALENAQFKIDN